MKPLKAHTQPNLFSLGVNVLLIEGWLSVRRRFQWILYNHIVMHVASVYTQQQQTSPHVTSSNTRMLYGLHTRWQKPIKTT